MRKLLVASQKGGVGKTTTSINLAAASALAGARVLLLDADPLSSISTSLGLAAHPQRQPLRQSGLDLPGVLVNDVLPGLDVLSPYEDGGCSDEDLDQLLGLVAAPSFQQGYDVLVVDTPPFLGANPGQLLLTCDEFILVMRAEPTAYRTLPAFMELVQRSRGTHDVKLRGILLTLPESEQAGGRWERELRGRLGTRILPLVVPHDESAAKASLFGQIVSQANPEAPAAQTYHALVESLSLSADARETAERTTGTSALLLASATLKNAAARRVPARPAAPAPQPPAEPTAEVFAPSQRRRTPVRPVPVAPAPAVPAAPPKSRTPPSVPVHVPEPVAQTPAQPTPASSAAKGGFPLIVGGLWVAVAIVVGVGLRFLKLPDFVVPILMGVGVGAAVVILARYLFSQEEKQAEAAAPAPPPPPRKQANAAGRLSGTKRRLKTPARDARGN